jgi:hypothetical protein
MLRIGQSGDGSFPKSTLGQPHRSAPNLARKMSDYEIVDTHAGNVSACGFCGLKAGRSEGHHRKSKWLKERYAERPISATRFINLMRGKAARVVRG